MVRVDTSETRRPLWLCAPAGMDIMAGVTSGNKQIVPLV